MVVTHNLNAINTNRMYGIVGKKQTKSMEKLSSGYRINRAADDAAGLAISEKMRKQIRGLNQGAANIMDGVSLCQVADGALSEVHDMLNRMTELSVHAANGTLSSTDRAYIQGEINSITAEINRIGHTTKFNEQQIFATPEDITDDGSITQLVSCLSADKGYFGEAYEVEPGKYMPAAYLDFSNVNAENVARLHGGNFGFYCSRGCDEIFDVTFVTDDTPSSASNLGDAYHTTEHHIYTINISQCKNGSDVVDAIYDYIGNHLPYQRIDSNLDPTYGDLRVSHSNNLAKVDSSKLAIYANRTVLSYGYYSVEGFATAEEAANQYPISGYEKEDIAGKIFCSNLSGIQPSAPIIDFRIQCSGEPTDAEFVKTYKMNSGVLGIESLDVSTQKAATNAIDKISSAISMISAQRADIGAVQNRLEHAYNSNLNTSENTQAAESKIRDTDMAKEMVAYSNRNILIQAGQAMLSQANQSQQGVLSLLQ